MKTIDYCSASTTLWSQGTGLLRPRTLLTRRGCLLTSAILMVLSSACSQERLVVDTAPEKSELITPKRDEIKSARVEPETLVDGLNHKADDTESDSLPALPSSSQLKLTYVEDQNQAVASPLPESRSTLITTEFKAASAKRIEQSTLVGSRTSTHSPIPQWHDRETYLPHTDNPVHKVSHNPVSTFSVDVDTASYTTVRRMIQREGRLPPRDAVKAEEFINYFNYQYPSSDILDQPFSVHTEIMNSPWNRHKKLLKIGLRGQEPEQRPAANLVFLVDVSGSMQSEHKLGLAKRSLKMLAQQMQEEDRIALVVYAGAAGVVLPSTSGDQKQTIYSAIDQLTAGGSTHGSAGIQLAYQVASEHFINGGINRVLIASDGDMNVGTVDHRALKDLVIRYRDSGIALSTLGFGSGNYNYALMEQLADVGNGNATYVDSLKEAHRVLVQQMNSTLMTIAKDVKVQIEFNPEVVAEYRLIGYQNRVLKQEDFRNDKVDAGEIGAGHRVTALYELGLVGADAHLLPQLRYTESSVHESEKPLLSSSLENELGFVKLRYKQPKGSRSQLITMPIARSQLDHKGSSSEDMNFSAAVAGFAQLLRGGTYLGDWGYQELLSLARNNRGSDDYGHRAEFVSLIELSRQWQQELYSRDEHE